MINYMVSIIIIYILWEEKLVLSEKKTLLVCGQSGIEQD